MFREFLWQEGHTAHSIMTKLGRSPLGGYFPAF
jgi:hypothetical protein